jgi:hypothetical protein
MASDVMVAPLVASTPFGSLLEDHLLTGVGDRRVVLFLRMLDDFHRRKLAAAHLHFHFHWPVVSDAAVAIRAVRHTLEIERID